MRSVGAATLVVLGCLGGCDGFGGSDDRPAIPPGDGGPTVNGTATGGAFTFKKIEGTVFLVQEATVTIPVTIERTPSQTNDVVVTVEPLPAGVTATPLTLTGTATTGEITLTASASAAQASLDVALKGDALGVKATSGLVLFVRGKPGTLDTTFGDGGRRHLPGAATPGMQGRMLLKNDQLYVVSDCAAGSCTARMSLAGALDPAYGGSGLARGPAAIALDTMGRLLIGGGDNSLCSISRADVMGQRDASFGVGVALGQPNCRQVGGIALSPANEIYYATYMTQAKTLRIRALDSAGQLLTTFGGGGANIYNWEASESSPTALFFRPAPNGDPGVLSLGVWTKASAPWGGFGIAHVGNGGLLAAHRTFPLNENMLPNPGSQILLSNGGMLTVGTASSNQQFFLKLDRDGNPDATWDTDGLAVLATGSVCRGVAVGPEGHVYCALEGAGDRIAKLSPGGKLDTSWGFNGLLTVPSYTAADVADIQVQPDGRILLLSAGVIAGSQTGYITRIWH